jgi:hypothetical protein
MSTQEALSVSQGALRFREVQRFSGNPLTWVAGLGLVVAFAGCIVSGPNPGSVILLVVLACVGFLLFFGELRTEVRDEALYTRVFPLTRQHRFSWGEIRSCEARTYRPLLEYGGWGVRCGRGGKAYNVSGNRGVQLEFTNGKRLLIGSQRPEELAAAIQELSARA